MSFKQGQFLFACSPVWFVHQKKTDIFRGCLGLSALLGSSDEPENKGSFFLSRGAGAVTVAAGEVEKMGFQVQDSQ